MPRKKLKPQTRIDYQRRDIRILRSVLEWSAKEHRRIAEASKTGVAVDEASLNAAAECERWLASVR